MAEYYKLGKKAKGGSFSETSTGVSIFGSKVVKLDAKQRANRRVRQAIEHGHLVPATEEEFNAYEKKNAAQVAESQKGTEAKPSTPAAPSNNDDDDDDEIDIYSMKKDELVAHALTVEGNDLSEEDLQSMKKDEIISHIESLTEGED